MPKELSRCLELRVDTYRDIRILQDVIKISLPFENGEQVEFLIQTCIDNPVTRRFKLPNEVYLLHARGSDEDSTGT